MQKSTNTPKKYAKYNPLVIEDVAKKYGFSSGYVRAALRGDRTGVMADSIIKTYKEMCTKVNNVLKSHDIQ